MSLSSYSLSLLTSRSVIRVFPLLRHRLCRPRLLASTSAPRPRLYARQKPCIRSPNEPQHRPRFPPLHQSYVSIFPLAKALRSMSVERRVTFSFSRRCYESCSTSSSSGVFELGLISPLSLINSTRQARTDSVAPLLGALAYVICACVLALTALGQLPFGQGESTGTMNSIKRFGGGRPMSGTPSMAWSCAVVIVSLLAGASIVHNIYKPNLTLPTVESKDESPEHE